MTASIRTPDQRVRVFVSSTLQELSDERAVAKSAIQHLRLTPVMFELGARALLGDPPRGPVEVDLASVVEAAIGPSRAASR
jgi:uncharacterized protein DUF4062